MLFRVRKYYKRFGFIVAGVLLGTSLGLSSVASAVVIGFNPSGRGFNRAGPPFPAFNRAGPPLAGVNAGMNVPAPTTAVQPISTSKSVEGPVINPVDANVANPCAAAEEAALIFINDECNAVVENGE
jgi:hypothetical protein